MSDLPCGHHTTVILKIWGCGKCWAQKYILASSTLVISSGLVLSVCTHEISGRMPRISWMSLFLIPVSLKSFFFFFFSWKAEWGKPRPAKEEVLQETLLPECCSMVRMAWLQERYSPICRKSLSASNNSYCVLLFLVHVSFGSLETCCSFLLPSCYLVYITSVFVRRAVVVISSWTWLTWVNTLHGVSEAAMDKKNCPSPVSHANWSCSSVSSSIPFKIWVRWVTL